MTTALHHSESIKDMSPATSDASPPELEAGIKRSWPHIILAAGFAVIIAMLVAGYINISIGENSIYATNASNVRIDNIDLLKEHLVDAEAGLRGYLLVKNEAFLHPYMTGAPKVAEDLKRIRKNYQTYPPDEQALIDRLERLVQQRLSNMQLILQQSQQGNADAARSLMLVGKPLMEQIREVRRDLRNRMLTQHSENIRNSLKGFNLMRGVVFVLGISTIVLLMIWFATTQRQLRLQIEFDRILLERNHVLEHEIKTRTEELVALAGYLSNARETEKANLARELHDELGALMTAAKHDAGFIQRKLPPDTQPALRERVERLQQTLNSIIALKRDLINNLRPAMLHDLGLLTALQNLATEFMNASEIAVKIRLPENEMNLPEPVALALFRIVQEAFTNSRKYSQASEILLELFTDERTIVLNLYDNGVGFDPGSPTHARHGLAGMKHRVQMLNGNIEIVSAPGKGVMITVEIPAQIPQIQERRKNVIARENA